MLPHSGREGADTGDRHAGPAQIAPPFGGRTLDRQLVAAATLRVIAETCRRNSCGWLLAPLAGSALRNFWQSAVLNEVIIEERGPSLFSSFPKLRRRLSMYNRVGSMDNVGADASLCRI